MWKAHKPKGRKDYKNKTNPHLEIQKDFPEMESVITKLKKQVNKQKTIKNKMANQKMNLKNHLVETDKTNKLMETDKTSKNLIQAAELQ